MSPCTRIPSFVLGLALVSALVAAPADAIPARALGEESGALPRLTAERDPRERDMGPPADFVPGAPLHGEVNFEPGDFIWEPQLSPDGPVTLVVSLPEQRIYVYRNGVRIGVSTVSTGEDGYETPTGEFVILQKRRMHHSNLYDDAPMPFMQRLTWSGIALHAGALPGHPASHGCVRLPEDFAAKLYEVTDFTTAVVVADVHSHPMGVVHPGLLAPIEPRTAFMRVGTGLDDAQALWAPERVPEGPMVAVFSEADRRVSVFRDGIEIARAPLVREGLVGLMDRLGNRVPAIAEAHAEDGDGGQPPQEAENVFLVADAPPPSTPDEIRELLGDDARILVTALPLDGPNEAATREDGDAREGPARPQAES
ncbi:L,D-transpeptidase family protein [Coralloluteibacterium thermophilus]|uniref:L,D-transpeptidase family protein n=1 Tax=Coralloluteibacterium thermophilum TaxID=2707049 RepID=A0ABV9NLH3_9GAMM